MSRENRQINFMKNALDERELAPGNWLVRLKVNIREEARDDSPIALYQGPVSGGRHPYGGGESDSHLPPVTEIQGA